MKRNRLWSLAAIVLMLALFFSCCRKRDREELRQELMNVDRAFSELSQEKGINKAFLEYIDDSVVLLRPNRLPVLGKEKVEENYSQADTNISLTWTPLYADVALSGDLGYTYGLYRYVIYLPEGDSETMEGSYASVWKKGADGNWKFVLDTGNSGLGRKAN